MTSEFGLGVVGRALGSFYRSFASAIRIHVFIPFKGSLEELITETSHRFLKELLISDR